MVEEAIRIDGLDKFRKNLRTLDKDLPKVLRLVFNEAGQLIVDTAKPKVPQKSGRAARSVRARSTQNKGRVMGGGKKIPYYPWLDFGGKVGHGGRVRRKFGKEGRYIYPAYRKHRDSGDFQEIMSEGLVDVASRAGIVVEE